MKLDLLPEDFLSKCKQILEHHGYIIEKSLAA